MLSIHEFMNKAKATDGRILPEAKASFKPGITYGQFLGLNGLDPKRANLMSYAMFSSIGLEYNLNGKDTTADVKHEFSREVINDMVDKAAKWVFDVAACCQTSMLAEKNYANLFNSYGSETVPWKINEIAEFSSVKFPKIVGTRGFKEYLLENTFVRYHTQATSTPGLIKMAVESCPFGDFLNDQERVAYNLAYKDFTNIQSARAIPNRALYITSAVLEASSALPPSWYMGSKARGTFPASNYAALVKVMKRGFEVANSTDGIDGITSLDNLKDIFKRISEKPGYNADGGGPDDDDDDGDDQPGGNGKGPSGADFLDEDLGESLYTYTKGPYSGSGGAVSQSSFDTGGLSFVKEQSQSGFASAFSIPEVLNPMSKSDPSKTVGSPVGFNVPPSVPSKFTGKSAKSILVDKSKNSPGSFKDIKDETTRINTAKNANFSAHPSFEMSGSPGNDVKGGNTGGGDGDTA